MVKKGTVSHFLGYYNLLYINDNGEPSNIVSAFKCMYDDLSVRSFSSFDIVP